MFCSYSSNNDWESYALMENQFFGNTLIPLWCARNFTQNQQKTSKSPFHRTLDLFLLINYKSSMTQKSLEIVIGEITQWKCTHWTKNRDNCLYYVSKERFTWATGNVDVMWCHWTTEYSQWIDDWVYDSVKRKLINCNVGKSTQLSRGGTNL